MNKLMARKLFRWMRPSPRIPVASMLVAAVPAATTTTSSSAAETTTSATPTSGAAETREFQAETRQLLDLMVHSIYSNKDSFLRELISNASDALDKLRLESLLDKDLDVDTSDLHITLDPDAEARTLVVADNGIGMSRDDVIAVDCADLGSGLDVDER